MNELPHISENRSSSPEQKGGRRTLGERIAGAWGALWFFIRHPRTQWERVYKLKTSLWPLLGFLARHNKSWLASRVLLLVTETPARDEPKHQRKRRRALILNMAKSGVGEDIESVFLDAGDYELIVWPSYVLRAIAKALLAPGLDHNNYLSSDPAVERSKARYREFLRATWEHYRAAKPVDVVVAGNYAYVQQREFGAALEEADTPFIALHKENVRPPRRVKHYWHHLYKERRGPFAGRRIIVYNEIERELQIASGVFDPDRIIVAGMPRLDRIHQWRRENAGEVSQGKRAQVLFFSFTPQSRLTAPGRKRSGTTPKGRYEVEGEWGNMTWEGVWSETHAALIRVARAHPELHVVMKIKGRLDKDEDLRRLLDGAGSLPANLEIISGGDPFHLIAASGVVVGFNTTGLLEAIAAGKPVIVPRFLEAAEPERQDLIIDLGEAVRYASSADDLMRLIVSEAARRQVLTKLPEPAAKMLRYWVGNDDGAAGRRTLEAIERAL
jgi:hypothetical protein